MTLGFSDGSNSNWTVKDAEGYYLNDDQMQNSTHVRTIDLSSLAGKTVNSLNFTDEADTAAGSWAIIYEQVSLVSTDGTVFPIYTGQTSSPVSSISSAAGVSGTGSSIDNNRGHAIYPTLTTTYYSADHLGSARMITSGNGYPVWAGVFAPFGREVNPQITMNTYKFTDDEHDSESNLEHTWFRQLSSTEGRWISPDPYSGSMDLGNPQSLNRYAYVNNNPVNATDSTGLICDDCDRGDRAFDLWVSQWGGGGGNCTLNGMSLDCGTAYGFVDSGAAIVCPNGDCSIFQKSFVKSNGAIYNIVAGVNGLVWMHNGEELGSKDLDELGLLSDVAVDARALIDEAKSNLSRRCNNKFGKVIPKYTKQSFFKSLMNTSIKQYPLGTPNIPPHLFGAAAETLVNEVGRPILLLPNFYRLSRTTQSFTLVHEGIHHFTGWTDSQVFQRFSSFGLTQMNNFGTSEITDWIQGGCK